MCTFPAMVYIVPMHHLNSPSHRGARRWIAFVLARALLILLFSMPGLIVLNRKGDVLPKSEPPSAAAKVLSGRNQLAPWYLRTGQWRADARTLVAAARWCFDNSLP